MTGRTAAHLFFRGGQSQQERALRPAVRIEMAAYHGCSSKQEKLACYVVIETKVLCISRNNAPDPSDSDDDESWVRDARAHATLPRYTQTTGCTHDMRRKSLFQAPS